MKKLVLTILATIALTGVSYAGSLGIGVSGGLIQAEASGTETTGVGTVAGGTANTNSQNVSAASGIASFFVDYRFDNGWALGYETVPGSADISDEHVRAETAQGISGTDASGAVTRKVKAEVENFNTAYIEMPMGSFYAKLGFSQIDVNTIDTAVTDSGVYGNKTIDGVTYGLGLRGTLGSFDTKTAIEVTDFDDISLSSSTNNSIKADVDVTTLKFSIVKLF